MNALAMLAVIIAVVIASLTGMGIVKGRLLDLTEKSTPFQTRSMELQRAVYAATADLVKVGSASSKPELKAYRQDLEGTLDQVKKAEDALKTLLGGGGSETYDQLRAQAAGLVDVTEGRLSMEESAAGADNELRVKLKDAEQRVGAVD